ncbi:hypothetical protein AURANDRAFT_72666 [Aureococcus anophagefferens]|uniref:Uncharacterized protein n=1 Tax=Aureococcus anophagefferens TaxID=44056 RepID=F0YMD5_AURAN|nr:hypothetical protein AURANDRAFT_72666 [Aureococcus anophagefferens]EGB03713.1 hypothetical protein AURANDRAFT_72666 [Aureococcus anophagefferens]|eukprot:XP_009041568.1 hypothetical protein AURANDRAFT_72666 [Aureococcus anophagefferens]
MSVLDLTRAGINFLAIDFDLTLVDTHTEGRWPGSPSELAARVRPNLRHLMNEAMDAGIHVAIVTLSPQVPLISAVLQLIFPASCDMIPIRGSDGNWFYAGQGSLEGKQVRMVLESPQFDSSAVEELTHCHSAQINRRTSLLIDDDAKNVSRALDNGVNAILFCPADSLCLRRGILALVDRVGTGLPMRQGHLVYLAWPERHAVLVEVLLHVLQISYECSHGWLYLCVKSCSPKEDGLGAYVYVTGSDSAFPVPLVDAELVEHFADVPPRLLGSSSVVVALDWACPSSVDLLRPREAIETPTVTTKATSRCSTLLQGSSGSFLKKILNLISTLHNPWSMERAWRAVVKAIRNSDLPDHAHCLRIKATRSLRTVDERALSWNAAHCHEEWLVVTPVDDSIVTQSLTSPLPRFRCGRPILLPEGIKDRNVLAEIKAGPDSLASVVGVRLCGEMTQLKGPRGALSENLPKRVGGAYRELWRGPGALQERESHASPRTVYFVVTAVILGTVTCQINDGECANAFLCQRAGACSQAHFRGNAQPSSAHDRPLSVLRIRLYDSSMGCLLLEAYLSETNVKRFVESSLGDQKKGLVVDASLGEFSALVDENNARTIAEQKICLPGENLTQSDETVVAWRPLQKEHKLNDSDVTWRLKVAQNNEVRELAARCIQLLTAIEGHTYAIKRAVMLQVVSNINKVLVQVVNVTQAKDSSLADARYRSAIPMRARRLFGRCRDGIVEELKRATLAGLLQKEICAPGSTLETVCLPRDCQIEVSEDAKIVSLGLDEMEKFVNWRVVCVGRRSVCNRGEFIAAQKFGSTGTLTLESPAQFASTRLIVLDHARVEAMSQLLRILNPCAHGSHQDSGTDFIAPQVFLGDAPDADRAIKLQDEDCLIKDRTRRTGKPSSTFLKRDTLAKGRPPNVLLRDTRSRVNAQGASVRLDCLKRTIHLEDRSYQRRRKQRKDRTTRAGFVVSTRRPSNGY